MASGYNRMALDPVGPGRANPLKVLVVVDPNASPDGDDRHPLPCVRGARLQRDPPQGQLRASRSRTAQQSVRFQACRPVQSREPWNRGTQFGGYFLVSGARCVHIDVATQGKVLRRKLSFGARCS